MRHWAILLAIGLSACTTAPIYLKHKETGEVVQCGPYLVEGAFQPGSTALRESQCIGDFQRQGYERLP